MADPGLVAIHQPNFLPWLGWWDKLARADVFILLDDVQFPKKGATYMNRVEILARGERVPLTVPVVRAYTGLRTVAEMRIDSQRPWRAKLVATLRTTYGRAPWFAETMDLLEPLLLDPTHSLQEYNERALREIAEYLGLSARRFVSSSTLESRGTGTERLISLVAAVGGQTYLAGGGAAGYQQDELLAAAGLGPIAQRFTPREYPQGGSGEFIGGLSVVDALMWCGATGTRALIAG